MAVPQKLPTPEIVSALVGATVTRVEQLSGGASSATFAVDAVTADGAPWPLILQCAATGSVPEGGLPRADQARLQQRAFERGLPVAEDAPPDNCSTRVTVAPTSAETISGVGSFWGAAISRWPGGRS